MSNNELEIFVMRARREFNIKQIEYGAYYPGVFIIKLNKTLHEDLQYDDFDDEDWRNFVHEYVHFLQDISLGHGYLYYYFKSQLFSLVVNNIKRNPSNKIDLPIQTEETGIKNASEKEMLLDFYEGDHDLFRFHHINYIKLENDVIATEIVSENSDFKSELNCVNIYYDDRQVPYQFGNICVIESMAYLIEYYIFGASARKQEFPYNSCEAICDVFCPELLKTPERIALLAELSLMHDDCGYAFYEYVKECANFRLWDLTDEDFRELCLGIMDRKWTLFKEAFLKASQGIDILFPDSFPYTYVTNMQLKSFLECGYNYRRANPFFISDIFQNKAPKEYFKSLICKFELPMLIDNTGTCYGKDGTQNIPVADAVYSLLAGKSPNGCKLQPLCKDCGIEMYDQSICTKAPWRQCKGKSLCPVAVYFKGFCIDSKVYKWRIPQ